MSRERVIELARGELGNTELPAGSNNTKYGAAYGLQGQPWCLIFLWWIFREAGESAAFFGGAKTASCGTLLRWYKAQGQTVPVSEVRPGDIVILNFHGTQDTEHCGLVTCVYDSDGWIRFVDTIEGNTSKAGSQDNGGMVCEKTRYPSQIVGVCRPKYKEDGPSSGPSDHLPPGEGKETGDELPQSPAATAPSGGGRDDVTGHWAEEAIRWCMETGIMQGYEDGTFKPDKGLTRAELATVLKRMEDKRTS